MALAQAANRYIEQKAPWRAIKDSREDAATTIWTSLSVVNCLKTAFYPFLPFSSEKLHRMLGFAGSVNDHGWSWRPDMMRASQELPTPEPLFAKLDEAIIERETERLAR